METYGRERRHRYFTLAAYKCVMANERLQDTTPSAVDVDLSRVGDFTTLDPKNFYATTGKLHSFQDSFKDIATTKGKKRKRDEGSSGEEGEPLRKPKRGRPRKTPVSTDASVVPRKRGRPRKEPLATGVSSSKPTGTAFADGEGQAVPPAAEQAAVSNRLASLVVQCDQRSSSTTADSSRVIRPAKQSAWVPPANQQTNGCDVEARVSHPTSEGFGDVQSSHPNISPSRRSSKRARITTLDVVHHAPTKPRNGAMVSDDPQPLEVDGPQGASSVPDAQGEEPIAIPVVSIFYVSSWWMLTMTRTRFVILRRQPEKNHCEHPLTAQILAGSTKMRHYQRPHDHRNEAEPMHLGNRARILTFPLCGAKTSF